METEQRRQLAEPELDVGPEMNIAVEEGPDRGERVQRDELRIERRTGYLARAPMSLEPLLPRLVRALTLW